LADEGQDFEIPEFITRIQRGRSFGDRGEGRAIEEGATNGIGVEQGLHLGSEFRIIRRRSQKEFLAILGRASEHGVQ
jgi:hypothetical protein